VTAYAVEDRPPPGWRVASISHGGTFDPLTGKVKFGPFYDAEPRGFSYLVFPPPDTQGVFAFTGTASADGVNTPIAGDQFRVVVGCHPAEVRDSRPPDWRMTIDEVTAYASAWRRGLNWIVPPNPIPIDYVTRAAFLWRDGECYEIDAAATNLPLCWVNCGATRGADLQPAVSQVSNLPTVRRQMPAAFVPGEPLIITLAISPANARAFAVEEHVPSGWIVADISDAGEFDAVNGRVKWGPFFVGAPQSLTYEVVPPRNAPASAIFSGAASFDGASMATAGSLNAYAAGRLHFAHTSTGCAGCFRVVGLPGQRYLIEASTDFQTWVRLSVVTIGEAPTEFLDPAAGEFSQRFYRAREER
jgi:hypothetical protein